MLSIAEHRGAARSLGAASGRPTAPSPRAALRALLRSIHRRWERRHYRPERRYMRG